MFSRLISAAVSVFVGVARIPIDFANFVWCLLMFRNYLYVEGRDLKSGCRTKILLRGINKMSVFDNDADPGSATSFAEIRKTGANSVRIVWAINQNLQPTGPPTDVTVLDTLITNAAQNKLIPMIELHDATGEWARLNDLVAYWTRTDVVPIIQKHQRYLLVNIGNEVGDDTVTAAQFIAGYTTAIQAMRNAGIVTPLVIDAPDWGKNLAVLDAAAATLLNADPMRNLIFSVHLYWAKSCNFTPAVITTRLQNSVALKYPLIVGEFSKFGGSPCPYDKNVSICSAQGEVDYQTILAVCHANQIGWYAWEWGPGNGYNDALCTVMDMTPDRLFANLKPGWAEEVATTSLYSIKNTSVTAGFF
jgi:mannan endo-1,4-beta-mannosidase